jgi:hypothetical protein
MLGMTLSTRSAASAAAAGALLALSACGGGPTSSATSAATAAPASNSTAAPTAAPAATPAPSPTSDLSQVAAVANRIFPATPTRDCFTGGLDSCPFTPRLKARMQAIISGSSGGGADPVCRCQNTYTSATVTAELVSGQAVAHVVLGFGPSSTVRMDWVFVQSGGAWLADDSYCTTQGSATSIYTAMRPCSG